MTDITFHASHSNLIDIEQDGRVAKKSTFHKNVPVFSSRTIRPGEVIHFRIYKNTPNEFRKALVGFTMTDPATIKNLDDMRCIPEYASGKCASLRTSTTTPNVRSQNVHTVHYTESGTVNYSVNYKVDGTFQMDFKRNPVWMFLGMGSLAEVEIIDSTDKDSMKKYVNSMEETHKQLNNLVQQASVFGMSKIPGEMEDMKFHKKNQLMHITKDGQCMEPFDTKLSVAFSSKPLLPDEVVCFVANKEGKMEFGFTQLNPMNLTESYMTKNFTADEFGPKEATVLAKMSFHADDILQIALVTGSSSQAIILGKNGKTKLTVTVESGRYWAVYRPKSQNVFSMLYIDDTNTEHESPAVLPTKPVEHNIPVKIVPAVVVDEKLKPDRPPLPHQHEPVAAPREKKPVVRFQEVPLTPKTPSDSPPATTNRSPAGTDASHYNPLTTQVFQKVFWKDVRKIKKIAGGSQGEVWQVSTPLLGRLAAKVFHKGKGGASRASMIKYEQRELDVLVRLNSNRYIISIYGFVFEDEIAFRPMGYLMEYMENGCLHNVIHDKDLMGNFKIKYDETHVYNWMQQIGSALHFMHSAGCLHRDIKPLNLLLTNDYEQLRVCDLGLAGEIREDDMTMAIGTYIYMAPELLASFGRSKKHYDEKCDVFSLGIVLYELVHRIMPYSGLKNVTMKSIVKDNVRPMVNYAAATPPYIELFKRCWSQRGEERPTILEICEFAHTKLQKLEEQGIANFKIRNVSHDE